MGMWLIFKPKRILGGAVYNATLQWLLQKLYALNNSLGKSDIGKNDYFFLLNEHVMALNWAHHSVSFFCIARKTSRATEGGNW